MTPAARVSAAIEILDVWLEGTALEQAFLRWARNSRYAGSKDRAAIRDHIFTAARRKLSDAALGGALSEDDITGRQLMIGQSRRLGLDLDLLFSGLRFAPEELTDTERHLCEAPTAMGDAAWPAPHWQYDIPAEIWPSWTSQVVDPSGQAAQNQDRAPITLRVNQRRLSRDAALDSLTAQGLEVIAHPDVPTAILVTKGNPSQCPAYLDGSVEIQDAHSQQLIHALPQLPVAGDVLDYCAGGGGKALSAYAHWGRKVLCHDIDPKRMRDIPMRAQRAQADVWAVESVHANDRFACVLVDAPCSGSGSWRRAPDGKWALTQSKLDAYCQMQRDILAQAVAHVEVGGWLYYTTCSVLRCENQNQAEWFTQSYPKFEAIQTVDLKMNSTSDGLFGNLFVRIR